MQVDNKYIVLDIKIAEIFLHLTKWMNDTSFLNEKLLGFIESLLLVNVIYSLIFSLAENTTIIFLLWKSCAVHLFLFFVSSFLVICNIILSAELLEKNRIKKYFNLRTISIVLWHLRCYKYVQRRPVNAIIWWCKLIRNLGLDEVEGDIRRFYLKQ